MKNFKFLCIFSILFIGVSFLQAYNYESKAFSIKENLVKSLLTSDTASVNGNILSTNYNGKSSQRKLVSKSANLITNDSLVDYFIKMADEEIRQNIRTDGTFCAGAKWPTAWTRDMSYAINLSLSFLYPEAVEKSLNSRIENGIILQDTGSGGSYPVSTDRVVWIIAAYDYALFKQDFSYFAWIFDVGKKTLDYDFNVNYDSEKKLFRGESSFLDWREQTYPRWADSIFIADSFALGTNNVYLGALKCMISLSKILNNGELSVWQNRYDELSAAIKEKFWLKEKGYFASYILSDIKDFVYEGYETLGESLSILNSLTDKDISVQVLDAVESGNWGMSVVAPQLANVPSYHNDAVWPFVQGYRGLACKKARDAALCEEEFASLLYAAAMFQTFKENYVASSFSPNTSTNSDRQLWSVAAYLCYVYKIICGLNFMDSGICINPLVFDSFKKGISLQNFSLGNTVLNLTITGNGDKIKKYVVNGKNVSADYIIPFSKNKDGQKFDIFIEMEKSDDYIKSYSLKGKRKSVFKATSISSAIPNTFIEYEKNKAFITWKPLNKFGYKVYLNDYFYETKERSLETSAFNNLGLCTVFANSDNKNIPALPAKVIRIESTKNTKFYEAENSEFVGGTIKSDDMENTASAKTSADLQTVLANKSRYIEKWGSSKGDFIQFNVNVKKEGFYVVDFRFKNGHGPINTGEKCAIRALSVDNVLKRRIAFPQQGNWTSWAMSSPNIVWLSKGKHTIALYTDDYCYSQHGIFNYISLDCMRFSYLGENQPY